MQINRDVVKVIKEVDIIFDMKCFWVKKPSGYDFVTSQATEVSVNLSLWKNQSCPFTFTCMRELDYLEFMITIYREHCGVTNMLGRTNAVAELI